MEHIKVKIIATLGPASNSENSIADLIDAGVNIFRLNFSYADYDSHRATIRTIRKVAQRKGANIGILQDICGPKIRVKGLRNPLDLKTGDLIRLSKEPSSGTITLTYPQIIDDLEPEDEIFFADGSIQTKVVEKRNEEIVLKVYTSGRLLDGKGVNLPKASIRLPALTKKDRSDLVFGAKEGVDFVAISFVGSEKDIKEARSILQDAKSDAWIVAKIERKSAIEHLEAIIDESDAVMVARGDLGAEAGICRVPMLQKEIIHACNEAGKPVVTATQMLSSMLSSPYPTRAEVSDIANAVLDGTDAVMLSDETAVGNYPLEAVSILVDTIMQSQRAYPYYAHFIPVAREAFPHAAVELSRTLEHDFICALTLSGYTLCHVSKFRPENPIFCITPNDSLVRKTTIVWGVDTTVTIKSFSTEKELVDKFLSHACCQPNAFLLVTGHLGEMISLGKSVRYIRPDDRKM